MCKGLRLSDGVCVGEVVRRGAAREGCSRELGVGRQVHLECSVLTLTLNEMELQSDSEQRRDRA